MVLNDEYDAVSFGNATIRKATPEDLEYNTGMIMPAHSICLLTEDIEEELPPGITDPYGVHARLIEKKREMVAAGIKQQIVIIN